MPWKLYWYRTSYLIDPENNLWDVYIKGLRRELFNKGWDNHHWKEEHDYTYVLKSGEMQNRTATIKVREMEWRRKWLMWTPLFSFTRKSIDVAFSDEVGERSGSWKGGTLGCGYDIISGEKPVDTLRRMETERTF